MILTTRPEPLRSSGCNIQMALTSFGNGESWDGCGSLFLLLSVPLPCRAGSLFPTLDGAWMTGSELPPGLRCGAGRAPRAPHPRRSARAAARPPWARRRLQPLPSSRDRWISGLHGHVISRALRASDSADK